MVTFVYAAAQFSLSTITVSAESVRHSTPAARVTWNTTAPPECVASVRVEFRTSSRGSVVVSYNSTNASGTAVIQTGLQCDTNYYIGAEVTRVRRNGVHTSVRSSSVQLRVGGNKIVCI